MPNPLAPLVVPVGELSSLGIGTETTFANFATPTFFPAIIDFNATPKNVWTERLGARKRYGQTKELIGGFEGKASTTIESCPDDLLNMLTLALGNSVTGTSITTPSAPTVTQGGSGGPGAGTTYWVITIVEGMVGETLPSASTSATTTSGQVNTVTAPGAITHGTGYNIYAGTASGGPFYLQNPSGPIALTVNWTEPDTGLITNSANPPQNNNTASTVLTLGSLPSFSAQLNRVTDAVDYLGCMIASWSLATAKGKGIDSKFNIFYANETIDGSPVSPSFSTKEPFTFENPRNYFLFGGQLIGAAGTVTVHSWDWTMNNNLQAGYYSLGASGRQVVTFPQQQRKGTGKVQLGFEQDWVYQDFLGGTSPQAIVGSYVMQLYFISNFGGSMMVTVNNVQLETLGTPIKAQNVIMQDFTYHAAESAPGLNNDIQIAFNASAT